MFLTVSHHIFLTREQRYQLLGLHRVEVAGNIVSVWVQEKTGRTDEPAQENRCRYTIEVGERNHVTSCDNGSFVIEVDGSLIGGLRDNDEGGSEYRCFLCRTDTEREGKTYQCDHYVNIFDESVLKESAIDG